MQRLFLRVSCHCSILIIVICQQARFSSSACPPSQALRSLTSALQSFYLMDAACKHLLSSWLYIWYNSAFRKDLAAQYTNCCSRHSQSTLAQSGASNQPQGICGDKLRIKLSYMRCASLTDDVAMRLHCSIKSLFFLSSVSAFLGC